MRIGKITALVLASVFTCISIPATVSAENTYAIYDSVAPTYEIAESPISALSVSGTTVTCTSQSSGDDAVTITVTQTLQKYWGLWIWNDVEDASWTKKVNSNSIRLSNTKSNLPSGKYRLKSEFTLINSSGKAETITVYSAEKSI